MVKRGRRKTPRLPTPISSSLPSLRPSKHRSGPSRSSARQRHRNRFPPLRLAPARPLSGEDYRALWGARHGRQRSPPRWATLPQSPERLRVRHPDHPDAHRSRTCRHLSSRPARLRPSRRTQHSPKAPKPRSPGWPAAGSPEARVAKPGPLRRPKWRMHSLPLRCERHQRLLPQSRPRPRRSRPRLRRFASRWAAQALIPPRR